MEQRMSDKKKSGVFIIAEIGKGFIQSPDDRPVAEYLENAKELVAAAKDTGADAVKFQTHTVEDEQLNIGVTSPHFKGADRYSWVARNTRATPLEEFWLPLKSYCNELGIQFFSTPMSRNAAKILVRVGVDMWKVGSGDVLDFVLLDYLAATKKPIILSTGMSTVVELDCAVDFLRRRNVDVTLLHCVSKYPCPPEELNLTTMHFLRNRYGVPVGFSDHSLSIESSLAAVALGATVIEKHFSFDRSLWGSDHKVSMLPEEMSTLVRGIRQLEHDLAGSEAFTQRDEVVPMLGEPRKTLQEDEAVFRPYFRKSLMAGQDISPGVMLTAEMIYAMRPQQFAGGLPSEEYERVVGRTTKLALKKYDPITLEALA